MRLALQVGSFKTTLAIFVTTAPEAYDGFGTFTVHEYDGHRLVAIQEPHVAWQTGRYASGLHSPQEFNGEHEKFWTTEGEVVDFLLARLSRKEAA